MTNVSLALAFMAGLLSFLSPCILPLIPAYLSYLTGNAVSEMTTDKARAVLMIKATGFVIGFSLIFIIMGASASTIGQLFAEYNYILRKVAGLFIILMGIHLTGLLKISWLYQEKRLIPFAEKSRLGPVFVGMAFATGWTPCIGPILSSILLYASSLDTIWNGVLLLTFYSLGMAIPFLLTALAIGSFTYYFKKFSKYIQAVSIISGILLIITGILVYTNKIVVLGSYLNFNFL
ncbi:MAG: disulfide bond formation protein DsbD [Gracilibacter sp. BRH_c7a]|nr:MAG: disulfide bond formation protein DsbD [Gracilibacter sp. BRH_c7a]